MKGTQKLHALGQSLWLDNITRDLLDRGTLKKYVDELSVTGLTSNPTIFDQAIKNSAAYDPAIREKLAKGKSGEGLFFELALEDLTRAADVFRPVWDRTDGVDGWVSLEVSPLLAYDATSTIAAARELFAAGGTAEPLHQDPGDPAGPAGDRGGDLRRRSDQRDAALLPRALRRRGRGVPARHRAAHRRRLEARRVLGRLGLHQPVGRRGGRKGAGRPEGPARHRDRDADVQGVPRPPELAALAAGLQRRSAGPSGSCGRARARRTRRPRTSCTSRRWRPRSRSTRCPRER